MYKVFCSICKTETKIYNAYVRMQCPCDEDNRIIAYKDIKSPEYKYKIYLLDTGVINYVPTNK